MYNLPAKVLEEGREQFWETVENHFGNKPIDILEVGVFQAKCISFMPKDTINVRSYTGVDPYLGDGTDGYTGGYWKDKDGASAVYESALKIFRERGAELVRMRSEEFFHKDDRQYDFIFVDADHRYRAALWDMCKWFSRVRPGGLLMIDDYGNIDTPDVTKAVNSFLAICRKQIGRMGVFDKYFLNRRKYVPTVSRYVYIEKSPGGGQRYSFNNGSSARNVDVEWGQAKRFLGIAGGCEKTEEVIGLCREYVDFVVAIEDRFPDVPNGIPAKIVESASDLDDVFVVIPNRGTAELEKKLQGYGMTLSADYCTLWL